MELHTPALVLSCIGFVSSTVTCILNAVLILQLKPWKKSSREQDYALFYYRFLIDIFLGFTVALYLGFIIGYCINFSLFEPFKHLVFYFSLPASNLGAARSIITLTIAVERCFAAWAPIIYHNINRHFPTITVFLIAISFGIFEDVFLYIFCDFNLNLSSKCMAFGCAINRCFYNYWTSHKPIIFALTALFSLLLCIKIFVMRNCGTSGNNAANLTRINRLSLLDAGCVFLFDFLPSFVANQWSQTTVFSFENIGPYGAVAKLFGCALESFIVLQTLLRRKKLESERSRSNTFLKRVNNNNNIIVTPSL